MKKKVTIYTIELEKEGSFGGKSSKYYYQTGTLEELIQSYSYTLEVGKSYEKEKGNKKINITPKNIKSLITNLNNAVDNAASNGYSGKHYRLLEKNEERKNVDLSLI